MVRGIFDSLKLKIAIQLSIYSYYMYLDTVVRKISTVLICPFPSNSNITQMKHIHYTLKSQITTTHSVWQWIIVYLNQLDLNYSVKSTHYWEQKKLKPMKELTLMILREPLNSMFLVEDNVHTGLSWASMVLIFSSESMSHTYKDKKKKKSM